MIPKEIIKKIKKIHIKSSKLVNTAMAGQYKSVFRGSGIEFEEVREYCSGDEVKSIDWKVSARFGKPFIKRYREERELICILLIDVSKSGYFGTFENLKQESSAEFASILAFNAIRNNDKVGAILFTDIVEKYIPPKKGLAHIWRLIKEIFTFKPKNLGTNIEIALDYLGKIARKKTVCFLISDFLCASQNYLTKLKLVSKKHQLISVLLSDPKEFVLPSAGIVTFCDFEIGKLACIDASNKKIRQNFENQKKFEYKNKINNFKTLNIDCIELSTLDLASDVLKKYFLKKSQKFRN